MTANTRQVLHTLGTRAAMFAVSGVVGIMLGRMLHPAGRGQYYVVVTVATTALILGHLSVEQAQVRLWMSARDRDGLAANSVVLGASLGAAAAVVAMVTAVLLGSRVLPVPGYGLLALALAALPGAMTVLYLNNILVLRARANVVNQGALLSSALILAGLVVLGWTGRTSVGSAVLLWTASMVVPLTLLLPAARPDPGRRDARLAVRTLGLGLRYHTGLASLYLLFRADILILNALTSPAAVGLYSLAVSLIEVARAGTDAVSQVVLPRQMEADHDAAAELTARMVRVSGLLSFGAVVALCVGGRLAVPIVYGQAFAGSAAALAGLAPGLCALGMTRTVGAFLLRLDRPMAMSAISVTALLLNIGLNFALIPRFGIVGSAAASSVAYVALAAMQAAWFLRASGLPARRLVPGPADVAALMRLCRWPVRGARA